MIAEEKRNGTLEVLLSRPLTERQIIYGKFMGAVVLVLLAMLPGIVYYLTVFYIGETPGNLDIGGTWGAYIGLFFLASIYAACGVFASSLSDNQVVAFIIAVLISLVMFIGFETFSFIEGFSKLGSFVSSLGINEHYKSMSRGVIDINDIAYFIVTIIILMETSRLVLLSGKWKKH